MHSSKAIYFARHASSIAAIIGAGLALTSLAPTSHGGNIDLTIKNDGKKVRTLSDLYAFDQAKNKGNKTELLKKGEPKDDINIAAGGQKVFTLPAGTKSLTISWLDDNKIEGETDTDMPKNNIYTLVAFTCSSLGQDDFAVAYVGSQGALPPDGYTSRVSNGKLGDPTYDWITFYGTSGSGGMIERDADGNPISPPLDGVDVTSDFPYRIIVPSPATLALIAVGSLVATRRRR